MLLRILIIGIVSCADSEKTERALKRNLTVDYDTTMRPVKDSRNAVKVTTELRLLNLRGMVKEKIICGHKGPQSEADGVVVGAS